MKLLIAIPAYNEEASIESIIERTLAARRGIINSSPVTEVEITVVSDGSTDRTVELASRYKNEINLIIFKKNRGYGAAIKEAWRQSDARLLGFLDADGTCDPEFFTQLCKTLVEKKADVVLGCRINRQSEMPLIRRMGNGIFAMILTMFSSAKVRDTSSGMRVVLRSSLPKLMPLPDGLHFTPAMSARAILSQDFKIVEIDMPYHERKGESKLSIAKDGIRFLKVILESAFLYCPSRPLEFLGFLCIACTAGLMAMPVLYYFKNRSIAEWMIYRFVVSNLIGTTACLLFCASYTGRKIVHIALSKRPWSSRNKGFLGSFFSNRFFWLVPFLLMLCGGVLVIPSFVELVRTGATYEHWSRFIAMSSLFSVAIVLVITRLLDYTLDLIAARVAYLRSKKSHVSKSV